MTGVSTTSTVLGSGSAVAAGITALPQTSGSLTLSLVATATIAVGSLILASTLYTTIIKRF